MMTGKTLGSSRASVWSTYIKPVLPDQQRVAPKRHVGLWAARGLRSQTNQVHTLALPLEHELDLPAPVSLPVHVHNPSHRITERADDVKSVYSSPFHCFFLL